MRLSKINDKLFRIGKWSKASQLFFDIFIFGAILFAFTLFNIVPWVLMWFYLIFIIFISGFVFTRPGQKYNLFLVIGSVSIVAFIPSQSFQIMLLSSGQPANPYTEDDLKYIEWNKGWNAYLSGLERNQNPYNSISDTPLVIELRTAWYEGYDTCEGYEAQGVPDTLNPYKEGSDQSEAWELGYASSEISENPYNQLTQTSLYHAFRDGFYVKHGYTDEGAIDASNLWPMIQNLGKNPFEDINAYLLNFTNVVNWIVFLVIIGYGIGGIASDLIKLNWGNIAKRVGIIALAITVMTFIYSLFAWIDIPIQTIWDTIGIAWNDMLRNVGLAQLDASGNTIANAYTIVNGFFKWIPLFGVVSMLFLAIAFRKQDLKSILFAKYVTEEDSIEVRETKFSIPVLTLIVIIGVYIIGYFLTTAEPTLTIDPLITLVFYITAIMFLLFIGLRWFIINKSLGFYETIKGICLWTIYGLMGLFLWFQVMQPAFYNMGWTDTVSGLFTLSQDSSILESDVLKQLFLVAAPETIIFQVGIIGLANRIYYRARRGSIQKTELKRLEKLKEKMKNQQSAIHIDPDSDSKKNRRNVGKWVSIQKKIDAIDEQLIEGQITKVPYSYFVLPTIIAALIGSFIFSHYHSYRRNISFQDWWQNPNYGLMYYGAGFFLSIIAFFNWFAAILVHALNNIIAIWLTGGLS